MDSSYLYFVFWIPLLVLGVGLLPVHFVFLKRLRVTHPSAWSGLGEPSLFHNNSIKNQSAVRQFIRSKAYLELHDPVLTKLAIALQWGGRIGIVLFVACLVAFFINFGRR
jgi:hypothetical protein